MNSTPIGFVSRSGTSFILNGAPFRFVGTNIYDAADDPQIYQCGPLMVDPDTQLDDWFARVRRDFNGRVIRFMAFQSFTNGGTNWRALDRVVHLASKHEFKVIPVLENQHSDCTEGGNKYADWYAGGYLKTYGDYRLSYKEFVRHVVERYKDEPAIFGWMLMNEAQSRTTDDIADPGALYAFARDVSTFVKSIDKNHLVTLGAGGGQEKGVWGWYERLHSLDTIDFLDFHDYGFNDVALPGAPAVPMALLHTMLFSQDDMYEWKEQSQRQNQPRVWETWNGSVPAGTQPFQTIGIAFVGGAFTGDVYVDRIQIGSHVYEFEDGTTQGWDAITGPITLSNAPSIAGSHGHSLKVTFTAADGKGGAIAVHAPADVEPGTPITSLIYVDTPGSVDYDGTLASAMHSAGKLNKPLLVGEAGMTTRYAHDGSQIETPESRAQKFDAKLGRFFDAGGAGYLIWTWHPTSSDYPYDFTTGDPLNTVLAKYSATFSQQQNSGFP